MREPRNPDWDPTTDEVLQDQTAAFDDMRRRCPVAYSKQLGWSVFRHEDVARVIHDHETFSNVVSVHRSVPNGMDPPEHTPYRRAIEPFFTSARMAEFEPICRKIAEDLLAPVLAGRSFDCVEAFAIPFSAKCQCAFLGWPDKMIAPIVDWTRRNYEAVGARDRTALADFAREFRSYVDEMLAARRGSNATGADDVTTSLMRTQVNGVPLSDDELTSILRNWTVGEVGSLASSVGILAHHLAVDQPLQQRLRQEPALLPSAIDEILRITGPLISNRRLTTRAVELGGRHIAAGETVSVIWVSANRDEQVFENPEIVSFERAPSNNLLYGAGIHVCPGAPLARLELLVATQALLARSERIELAPEKAPERDVYPANGWASLPLRLT